MGSGGLGRGSKSTQGRWELEPLFLPDALRRFHEKKSLLLVRGQFAAVLDKAHFFTERAFKARTAATNAVKSHLHIPTVSVPAAGVTAQPQTVAASIEASRENPAMQDPATSKHESSRARVFKAASVIFVDTKHFEAAFLLAMNHASNQEIARLCSELRQTPEWFGDLRPRRGGLFAWIKRGGVEALTQKLRAEIMAARRALNNDRTEHVAALAQKAASAAAVADGAESAEQSVVGAGNPGVSAASPGPTASLNDNTLGDRAAAEVARTEPDREPNGNAVVEKIAVVDHETRALIDVARTAVLRAGNESLQCEVQQKLGVLETVSMQFVDAPNDLVQHLSE